MVVWQKPRQHCKAIFLQLKKIKEPSPHYHPKKENTTLLRRLFSLDVCGVTLVVRAFLSKQSNLLTIRSMHPTCSCLLSLLIRVPCLKYTLIFINLFHLAFQKAFMSMISFNSIISWPSEKPVFFLLLLLLLLFKLLFPVVLEELRHREAQRVVQSHAGRYRKSWN